MVIEFCTEFKSVVGASGVLGACAAISDTVGVNPEKPTVFLD